MKKKVPTTRVGLGVTYQSLRFGPPEFPSPQKTHQHDFPLLCGVAVGELAHVRVGRCAEGGMEISQDQPVPGCA